MGGPSHSQFDVYGQVSGSQFVWFGSLSPKTVPGRKAQRRPFRTATLPHQMRPSCTICSTPTTNPSLHLLPGRQRQKFFLVRCTQAKVLNCDTQFPFSVSPESADHYASGQLSESQRFLFCSALNSQTYFKISSKLFGTIALCPPYLKTTYFKAKQLLGGGGGIKFIDKRTTNETQFPKNKYHTELVLTK